MAILITGVAGFIGFHLAQKLLQVGEKLVGVDNLNDYYDVELKKNRLAILQNFDQFTFIKADVRDELAMNACFKQTVFRKVVHLAGQAGVRYSLENPQIYVDHNVTGFMTVLECCRQFEVGHLIYASSSAVYGDTKTLPFKEDSLGQPLSPYAVSKRSNELMAGCYAQLYGLKVTGLRFFTVYGPWGRPDMALFLFTQAIIKGEPITLYNQGQSSRDYTYIDDVIAGILLALGQPLHPHCVYNLGSGHAIKQHDFVHLIEAACNQKARINLDSKNLGEVNATLADINLARKTLGYEPKVVLEQGIQAFIKWYLDYTDRSA